MLVLRASKNAAVQGIQPVMQVAVAGSVDPQALQQLTVLRRKEVQQQRLADYQEAVVTLKSKVRDAEGQAMRETVQDKVCTPCPVAALCCGISILSANSF